MSAIEPAGGVARLVVEGLSSPLAGPFDLSLAPGACAAITGPSGSGKSLMLRMIADLDPNAGAVRLGEVERSALPAPAWRRRAIYVAAESGWWADTVAEHFGAADLEPAKRLGDRLGLKPDLFAGPVSRLSSGEKQRLALIRALVLDPPVLLLDEPTGSLDQESVARVETMLKERLTAGLILVLVTHDPAQATRMGDLRFRMTAGKLEAL